MRCRSATIAFPSPDRGLPLSLERCRTPRIPFVATAEIIDEAENTRSTSQLSDLGLHGCFVQLTNPLPEGTPVTIEILKTRISWKRPLPSPSSCQSAVWDSALPVWSPNLLAYSRNGFRDQKLPCARIEKKHAPQSTNRAAAILICT